jgi:hypothetical protein
MRYCVVVKADIPKCDNKVDVSRTRFHSRDNRLKGHRRSRTITLAANLPDLETY